MGLRKLVKRYKDYENKELARRAALKKKVAPYKKLANKNIPVKKAKRVGLSAKGITRAINNPYNVKFPKAKKVLKNTRKRIRLRKQKVVVVYR